MNGGAVTLIYDGDGNRVAKSVNGVTTRYLIDDLNPTGLPQVVEELVNDAVQRQYTYGLQLISENQLISNTWTASFYETDGAGNVRQLTNSAGTVTDSYEYDAFGNEVNSTGSTSNNYLYRSEQWDPDLGAYYLRARYYNPLTGRFLSVDPEAGEGQRRYEYAGADFVNGTDPSGNEAIIEWALLTFYPKRLPIVFPSIPWWCGLPLGGYLPGCGSGSGGNGGNSGAGPAAPGGPPPPPPTPCASRKCTRQPHVVKEMLDDPIIRGYWATKGDFLDRDVHYWAYDLNDDQTLGYRDTSDIISLKEVTLSGSNQGTCTAGACPGSVREFVDEQRVIKNAPFTVRREWSVGGIPVDVWNLQTNSLAPYEILHLNYSATPPFKLEYGK